MGFKSSALRSIQLDMVLNTTCFKHTLLSIEWQGVLVLKVMICASSEGIAMLFGMGELGWRCSFFDPFCCEESV